MIILDVEQGSEQWFTARIGKPSASNASRIVTRSGAVSKSIEGYKYELIGELLTGSKSYIKQNDHMLTGIEREDESRYFFELITGIKATTTGLIYKDESKTVVCSPDALTSDGCGLELKNVLPKTQVEYLLKNKVPNEYWCQCQFSMYVTGFKKWHFLSYVPMIKPHYFVIDRDEEYISILDEQVKKLVEEINESYEWLKVK